MKKRYKQIVLHAGLPKTGTTSIQGNCHRYWERLANHSIFYPVFRFRQRELVNHSSCITAAFCEKPGGYGVAFNQQVTDSLDEWAEDIKRQMHDFLQTPDYSTLVLSGEAVAEYSDKDLRAVYEQLIQHTESLRVLIYVRSPQSTIESSIQQIVKSGSNALPKTVVANVRRRYQNLRRNFASVLEVFNFHEACEHSTGLVGHFLEQLSLPQNVIGDMKFNHVNERLSKEAFMIMHAINERYPRRRRRSSSDIRKPNDLQSLKHLSGEPFFIDGFYDSDEYREALEQGRWLENELGIRFPEIVRKTPSTLWTNETLNGIDACVRGLNNIDFQMVAADFVEATGRSLETTEPQKAQSLIQIAVKLRDLDSMR